MSTCLTENSSVCSNEAEAKQSVSSAMDLSNLTLNFRALNLLDKSLSIVSKISEKFGNSSPESTTRSKNHGATNKSDCETNLPIISLDEVAWHDTMDDCWLVICDYVYDCTNFFRSHPGGQDVLLEYAGRDATLAFIGYGHSKGANKVLERFLIGELPVSERIFRIPNGIKIGDCV